MPQPSGVKDTFALACCSVFDFLPNTGALEETTAAIKEWLGLTAYCLCGSADDEYRAGSEKPQLPLPLTLDLVDTIRSQQSRPRDSVIAGTSDLRICKPFWSSIFVSFL
jgi:hypothetical protein